MKTILRSLVVLSFILCPSILHASKVVSVAAGERHSVALTDEGKVWAWGANGSGQVGDGTTDDRLNPVRVLLPSAATGYFDDAAAIAAGTAYWLNFGGHTVILRKDGTVWGCGYNNDGELGDGSQISRTPVVQVNDPADPSGYLADVKSVGAGAIHTLAVMKDGTLRAWGYNGYGQLGNGSTSGSTLPVSVQGLQNVTAASGGYYHSVFLRSDGTVWAVGGNGSGQLGDGSRLTRTIPVKVPGLTDVVAVDAGDDYTAALKNDGTVWSWGANFNGQLGRGTIGFGVDSLVPVQVKDDTDPSGFLTDIAMIAAGNNHCLALKKDGTLRAWGDNTWNQIGDGTVEPRTTPVTVTGISDVTYIAAGNGHCLAVKSDGTVWGWGGNWSGQLGDGTTEQRSAPVQAIFPEEEASTSYVELIGPHFVTPGEDITYLARYRNVSAQALEDAFVILDLPPVFSFVSATGTERTETTWR